MSQGHDGLDAARMKLALPILFPAKPHCEQHKSTQIECPDCQDLTFAEVRKKLQEDA